MGLISRVSSRTYRRKKKSNTTKIRKLNQIMLRFTRPILRISQTQVLRQAAAVAPEGSEPVYSPHIHEIVDKIGSLSILEVSQLNTLLKKTFNLSDVAAAPMMAAPMMGGMPAGGAPAAAAPAAEEDEEAAPVVEQTEFTVKLVSFDAKAKMKVIEQLKSSIEGATLVQAKKMAESVPIDLLKDVGKDEAEEMAKVFKELGAEVKIE